MQYYYHFVIVYNNCNSNIFHTTIMQFICYTNRKFRSDRLPKSDRLLAEEFWKSSTEVSPNAKDVITLRNKGVEPIDHPVHRQYHINETIHTKFIEESSCKKMSLTIFNDCKPWYIREGKNDTCLCRTCEDFRLAKKAVSYNYNVLRKPFTLRPAARLMIFFFCAMKAGREYYGVTGYRDPAMLTRGKVLYNIV